MVKIVKKTDANLGAIRNIFRDFMEKEIKSDYIREYKTNEWKVVKLNVFYHLETKKFYFICLDKDMNEYNIWRVLGNTFTGGIDSVRVSNGSSIIELYKTDKNLVKILPV